jgi:hypothetical protein
MYINVSQEVEDGEEKNKVVKKSLVEKRKPRPLSAHVGLLSRYDIVYISGLTAQSNYGTVKFLFILLFLRRF